jgi:hypothetical protein
MKVVLATEIGTVAYLRIYVSSTDSEFKCTGSPKGRRGSKLTYHNAKVRIATSQKVGDFGFAGGLEGYDGDPRWPEKCDGGGRKWDELGAEVRRQVFYDRLYDTERGEPEPGCLFWVDWEHWEEPVTGRIRDGVETTYKVPTACPHGWSNCDGRHLHAITPDGHEWDIDGRASNCTLREDQEHRCWVRTGEPPNVTAGKGGNTCSAGAGSIAAPNWHGFLRSGRFVG